PGVIYVVLAVAPVGPHGYEGAGGLAGRRGRDGVETPVGAGHRADSGYGYRGGVGVDEALAAVGGPGHGELAAGVPGGDDVAVGQHHRHRELAPVKAAEADGYVIAAPRWVPGNAVIAGPLLDKLRSRGEVGP